MDVRPEPAPDNDTSREALRAQFAALRRLTARERLAMVDDLTGFVRAMTREGLRRRHPGIGEAELDEAFSRIVLGEALAARVRSHRRERTPPELP
jgi:hypothetical protein